MSAKKVDLPPSFTESEVIALAQKLLGAEITTQIGGHLTSGIIVETEAYKAPEDKASHAYGNKRTIRTETMFATGGIAYIYLCYGIHHLFNIVTGPEDVAHAILIRAIEPKSGIDVMMRRRGKQALNHTLTSGPGSLSKALGITTQLNGISVIEEGSPIFIKMPRVHIAANDIIASPRVGVDYAEECAEWPWRFRVRGNPGCSPAK